MFNPYFHEVAVTFNTWMAVAPLLTAMVVVIATMQYDHVGHKCFRDWMLAAFAGIAAAISGALFYFESWLGLYQAMLNEYGVLDEVSFTKALALVVLVLIWAVYGELTFMLAKFAALARLGWVVEQTQREAVCVALAQERHKQSVRADAKTAVARAEAIVRGTLPCDDTEPDNTPGF